MAKLDDYLDAEEHFFHKDKTPPHKKEGKSPRQSTSLPQKGQKKGRVLSLSSDQVTVSIEEKLILCSIKGTLKQQKGREKILLAVGDWVQVDVKTPKSGLITAIEPRYSVLARRSSCSPRKRHLIAVNIDQVLITLSVVAPRFDPLLIDRYIIAAKKGNMEPVILINKIDLLSHPPKGYSLKALEEEKAQLTSFCEVFAKLDIPLFKSSCHDKSSLANIKQVMHHKTSVFSGPSGVGKSSLINAITNTSLAVGDLAKKTKKGRHTTSTATLIPLGGESFCIDTPGIQSFSLWDLTPSEVRSYFPDFSPFDTKCRFSNCTHHHEPNCGVKKALEQGEISPMRYASYLSLLENPSPKEWE